MLLLMGLLYVKVQQLVLLKIMFGLVGVHLQVGLSDNQHFYKFIVKFVTELKAYNYLFLAQIQVVPQLQLVQLLLFYVKTQE